jgi:hypothetical protein
VEYSLDIRWAWLQVGDVVTITDDEMHFDETVALIRSMSWRDNQLSVVLILIEDIVRDTRLTG